MSDAQHEFPVYARLDLEIVSGDGCHVVDSAGGRWLDLYGGHAVVSLGYGHPALNAAIREQTERLIFQTNAVSVAVRDRACKALADFAPDGIDRVFLSNTGAEANENALRIAFRKTGRTKAITLENGWHGRTTAAATVTEGAEKWFGFPRTPFDVVKVPEDDIAALEAAMDDDVACVIVEPVQGMAGARDLSLDWLRAARALTEKHGALLICDEVQCGMGRTGHAFAIEAAGVVPDIITTAKALGGGFPVAAILATAAIADELPRGALGTTFGGGPVAAAVVEAVVGVMAAPGFLGHVQEMGALIRERCCVGPVVEVQGRGLLVGLRTQPPAKEVLAGLRERGILAGSSSDPHVLRLMPPLVLQAEHVETLATALAELPS